MGCFSSCSEGIAKKDSGSYEGVWLEKRTQSSVIMFNLSEKLETRLEIDDREYEVDMSFDNVMLFLDVVEDPSLTDVERVYYGIYTLLGTELNLEMDDQVKVFEALVEHFVHGGDKREATVDLEGNVMPEAETQPTYDLKHDAQYIYSSFRQAYGINLFEEQGRLDWREFKALLRDLPDDTKLKQVIDIRVRPYPKGKGMSEERRRLKELKRHYALPEGMVE